MKMLVSFAVLIGVLVTATGDSKPLRTYDIHEGQVLIKNKDCLIVKGDEWSGWVHYSQTPDCQEGDIVRITGKSSPYKWTTMQCLRLHELTVLGAKPLPATKEASGHEIPDGRLLFDFVRIKGVIRSVSFGEQGWTWVTVRTASGDVGVTIRESYHTCEELRRLLDAEVSIRGIVVYSWGSEQGLGAHISQRGEKALKVLVPPPANPFDAPPYSSLTAAHRQTLTGVVCARSANRLVVRSDRYGIVQAHLSPETSLPDIGHRVTISGFADTDPIDLRFRETLCRDEGPVSVKATKPTIPTALQIHDANFRGQLVTIEGRVLGLGSGLKSSRIISIECHGTEVLVDTSGLPQSGISLPTAESVVRITGFLLSEYENTSALEPFPLLRHRIILPRSPADLVTVQTPPWWTSAKFLVCLALLLALYVLREIAVRSMTRLKLRERTMLAVDIHDSLAQHLTGVSLQLDAVELAELAHQPEEANAHLSHARQALRSCRENLRYCLGDLRRNIPDAADMNAFITEIVRPHIGSAKLRVRVNFPRHALSDKQAYAIGSVIRELAVNAVRHGKAQRILVAGERKENVVRFSVHDNGNGFDPLSCPGSKEGHFGLVGIRERIKPFHGDMRISSRPGHGAKIIVTLNSQPSP